MEGRSGSGPSPRPFWGVFVNADYVALVSPTICGPMHRRLGAGDAVAFNWERAMARPFEMCRRRTPIQ
jgi:hypothetical protein